MTLTSHELLDTSIGQLRLLADFLADQLSECDHLTESGEAEIRVCLEILLSLEAIIRARSMNAIGATRSSDSGRGVTRVAPLENAE